MPAGAVIEAANFRLEIVRAAQDTGGAFLEMAATYGPGSKPPPMHYHPEQEETFAIKRGAMRFVVSGDEKIVAAGESLVIPVAAPHLAHNASATEEAIASWIVRPALRTEELFAAMYDLRKRKGGFLGVALIAHEFRREFVLAKIPRPVQSCVFGLLAPLARALGHRIGA